jgi:hypothetical protein
MVMNILDKAKATLSGTMADIGNRDQWIGDDPINKMAQ